MTPIQVKTWFGYYTSPNIASGLGVLLRLVKITRGFRQSLLVGLDLLWVRLMTALTALLAVPVLSLAAGLASVEGGLMALLAVLAASLGLAELAPLDSGSLGQQLVESDLAVGPQKAFVAYRPFFLTPFD